MIKSVFREDELTLQQLSEKQEKKQPRRIQVGGSHYTSMEIQPWDVWRSMGIIKEGLICDILAYVMRFRSKNGVEDLKKAQHCLDQLIEEHKE